MKRSIQTKLLVAVLTCLVSQSFLGSALGQGATGGVVGKQNKDVSGSTDASPTPQRYTPRGKMRPVQAPGPKTSACAKAVGVWFWVTEVVTIKSDGSMSSKGGPGNWTCIDEKLHVFWPGFIVPHEIFSISEDGNRLISHNTSSAPTRIR